MKFKYNYPEHRLWRIEENYLYEVGEENRQVEVIPFIGYKIRFRLGENEYLFLSSDDEFSLKMTVWYRKPLKSGAMAHYERKIERSWFGIETTFEFTETDRINNHHEK